MDPLRTNQWSDALLSSMTEANLIQFAFPSEPDWKTVSDNALIELVQTYQDEPSCAESAIIELKSRKHPQTEKLCIDLVSTAKADKWLRSMALGVLLSLNPPLGLNIAIAFIDNCELELLQEVIEALNYERQGSLATEVLNHPIVQQVKNRLAQPGFPQTIFSQIFEDHFGN